jgi:hypothetical protein
MVRLMIRIISRFQLLPLDFQDSIYANCTLYSAGDPYPVVPSTRACQKRHALQLRARVSVLLREAGLGGFNSIADEFPVNVTFPAGLTGCARHLPSTSSGSGVIMESGNPMGEPVEPMSHAVPSTRACQKAACSAGRLRSQIFTLLIFSPRYSPSR